MEEKHIVLHSASKQRSGSARVPEESAAHFAMDPILPAPAFLTIDTEAPKCFEIVYLLCCQQLKRHTHTKEPLSAAIAL